MTGYVLHQAIVEAQAVDTPTLLSQLGSVFIPNSLWGPIQFSNVGANSAKVFLNEQIVNLQNVNRPRLIEKRDVLQAIPNLTLQIITPLSATTFDAIFPLPGWNQRAYTFSYLKTPPEIGIIATTSFLLACTLILMIVLIFMRNTPQIKSASFVFCELILLGCASVYASMYFWVIYTLTPLCNLQVWLFIMGLDVALGGLLAKNLRLFYIFKNAMKLRRVKPIENWHLMCVIGVVMAIDAVIIIVWEAAYHVYAVKIIAVPNAPSQDYTICTSLVNTDVFSTAADTVQTGFFATLGAFKAILLLIGCFLSVAVRKQPSEFNESRTIALAIYNVAFCLVAFLAIWLAIPDSSYSLKYILRSVVVLWGNSITILAIFGRKMYYILIGKNKAYKGRGSSSHGSVVSGTRETSAS